MRDTPARTRVRNKRGVMDVQARDLRLSALVACGIIPLLSGAASAQVLIDDGFGDGDRDNDALADGFASDPSDIGAAWYLARGTSSVAATVADQGGSNSAFDMVSMTSSTRPVVASFPSTTLVNDGDRISMKLDVRLTESPIDPTDGGMVTGDNDRRFRFGLYNSQSTPVTEDTSDSLITGNDTGFLVVIDVDAAAGNAYSCFGDKADGILGGSSVSLGATSTDPTHFIDNTFTTLELTITKTGDELSAAIFFDGVLAQDGTAVASDIAAFNLPFTFDQAAFGVSGASYDYQVDNVVVEFFPASTSLATQDGFEDGDLNNDGSPEGPVNDAGDVGFTWYNSKGNGGLTTGVADDSGGIGSTNALQYGVTVSSNRAISAAIDEITLAEVGDQVSFAFDMRVDGAIPSTDRRFRFGIHHDGGTPVTANGFEQTGDDSGYMAQFDTGTASGTTSTLRGDLPNGLITGSTRSLGASRSTASDAITSNSSRRYEIRVRRVFDGGLNRDVNSVTLLIDGEIALDDGVDSGDGGAVTDPLTFSFNQITIGTAPIENINLLIDNVAVQFIPGTPDAGNLTDGFEDGDRDNNGSLDGPVNDSSDAGFAWYRSRGGSSAPFVEVVDDSSGIGTQNALNIFTLSGSRRALSAAIPEIRLESPGDFVSMGFDIRLRGPVPENTGAGFRFGIHEDGGTPVTQDGGTTVTNDDLGYAGYFDLGPSIESTASVRGDNDPTSFLGGTVRALGGTTDDPTFSLDDNDSHRIVLEIEKSFDAKLGRDVNLVRLFVDGTLATSGIDDGDEMGDNTTVSDFFNQITVSFNESFVDALFDNFEIQTNVQLGCPADVDGDGELTFFDTIEFLRLFDAEDPAADLDEDSLFTPTDVFLHLTDFAAGCD
ncbi:MAG: GC-type dockerin domain-anchored protein [Planctomycetota bacterium]